MKWRLPQWRILQRYEKIQTFPTSLLSTPSFSTVIKFPKVGSLCSWKPKYLEFLLSMRPNLKNATLRHLSSYSYPIETIFKAKLYARKFSNIGKKGSFIEKLCLLLCAHTLRIKKLCYSNFTKVCFSKMYKYINDKSKNYYKMFSGARTQFICMLKINEMFSVKCKSNSTWV